MRYPGGKFGSGVYQAIINQMPPHALYCEPFVGGGAVFLHKRPAPISILIDADVGAVQRLASIVNSVGGRPDNPCDVHLLTGDGISYLQHRRWATSDLVYLDPPYPLAVRRRHRPLYRCELSAADHDRIVGVVLKLPCMVMVSGYDGPPYSERLAAWRCVRYRTRTHRDTVQELLWCNFPEPVELHDPRYVGRDYRERERVKRLVDRWVLRIGRLPAPVRAAVLDRVVPGRTGGAGVAGPA